MYPGGLRSALLNCCAALRCRGAGGVENLTRCMALALAPHGIRVNSVGPGSIMTDVLKSGTCVGGRVGTQA